MKSALLIFLFLLSSCSTVIQTAGGKFISPEAQGGNFAGNFNATSAHAAAYKMNFTANRTDAPLEHANSGRALGVAGELGVLGPIDLLGSFGAETGVGIKWQFAGDTRTSAKGGSISSSLIANFASINRSADSDDEDNEKLPSNADKIDFEQKSKSYGLLLGYRVGDPLLLYVGVLRILEEVKGKVTTEESVLNDAPFSYQNEGELRTIGAIYYWPPNYVIKIELSNLETKWSNTEKEIDNGWNVALGFAW